MIKKIVVLLVFSLNLISLAQNKDCSIDFEEKTDSTYIKKTTDFMLHEKVFGNATELVMVSILNNNGTVLLSLQMIQKSPEFIPAFCFDKSSKIYFQLNNGKIITLLNVSEDTCASNSFDTETKNNIKVITNYFVFVSENYQDLKTSPISLMRIKYLGETKDYAVRTELKSEILNKTVNPSLFFIDNLNCIDN